MNVFETNGRFEKQLPDFLVKSQQYSLVVTDMSGYYVYVNEVFRQRFSFIAEDFIGIHSFVTIHPDDHNLCLNAVYACIANPEQIVQVKLRKPDANKQDYYWTAWEFSAFYNVENLLAGILCIGHDVTDIEHSQYNLIHITDKMDSLIEEISDSFIQVDREWQIKKCNGISSTILELESNCIIGQKLSVLLPGFPDFNHTLHPIQASPSKRSFNYEYYHQTLHKWFSTILYPTKEGYNIFLRDITKDYLQQAQIKESEYKLKAIINSTRHSNLLLNVKGELINYNKAAKEGTYGYFHENLQIGKHLKSILPKESADTFEVYFTRALHGEDVVIEVERTINGKPEWFEVTYTPVFDDEQSLIGVSKDTVNITDRKLAKMTIEAQERILRFMYDSTTDACSFIDRDFRFRYLNKVSRQLSEKLLGKKASIGDRAIDYILPPLQAEFQQLFESVIKGAEVNVERFDGTDWWQVVMKPVFDNTQQIIGISQNFKNITEKKKIELQLIKQNNILRGIAYQQSHELRRPVAAILGLCDLIQYETSGSDNELNILIENLKITVQELDDSIRQAVKQVNEFEKMENTTT
jgi:PAS domain S-box-containing protein